MYHPIRIGILRPKKLQSVHDKRTHRDNLLTTGNDWRRKFSFAADPLRYDLQNPTKSRVDVRGNISCQLMMVEFDIISVLH